QTHLRMAFSWTGMPSGTTLNGVGGRSLTSPMWSGRIPMNVLAPRRLSDRLSAAFLLRLPVRQNILRCWSRTYHAAFGVRLERRPGNAPAFTEFCISQLARVHELVNRAAGHAKKCGGLVDVGEALIDDVFALAGIGGASGQFGSHD